MWGVSPLAFPVRCRAAALPARCCSGPDPAPPLPPRLPASALRASLAVAAAIQLSLAGLRPKPVQSKAAFCRPWALWRSKWLNASRRGRRAAPWVPKTSGCAGGCALLSSQEGGCGREPRGRLPCWPLGAAEARQWEGI
jgi:hypothetical protein